MIKARFVHYTLGVPEIDEQHINLARGIYDLKITIKLGQLDKCKRDLAKLASDIKEHFDYEEALMVASNYPYIPYHKYEHLRLLREVESLIKLDTLNVKNNILEILETVVYDHIDTYDRQFAEYLKEQA